MNDHEIRALSQKLTPLAQAIIKIFEITGVPIPPMSDPTAPGYDHERQAFSFGRKEKDGQPLIYFGNIRPRPGAAWVRHLGKPVETGTEAVEAITRSWEHVDPGTYPVVLEESIQIEDGVQSVRTDEETWGSNWEIGGRLETKLETSAKASASYMGVSAEASVSASVTAEINAKGGGSKGGTTGTQDTKTGKKGTTRSVRQEFKAPGQRKFNVLALYDKTNLTVPYHDTLPLDCSLECAGMDAVYGTYDKYWAPWMGSDWHAQADSLLGWLSGFFGQPPAGCDDFADGLDITFSTDPLDTKLRDLIDDLRDAQGAMTITRQGSVEYANASAIRYKDWSEPLEAT